MRSDAPPGQVSGELPPTRTVSQVPAEVDAGVLCAGQELSHYEIVGKIGEGGMGTVYRAVDKTLRRTGAVRRISKGHLTTEQRLRFAHEPKAASALNRPNIVTIYEY